MRVLRRDQPALEAALPVAGVALEGQRRGHIHHLHLLADAREALLQQGHDGARHLIFLLFVSGLILRQLFPIVVAARHHHHHAGFAFRRQGGVLVKNVHRQVFTRGVGNLDRLA